MTHNNHIKAEINKKLECLRDNYAAAIKYKQDDSPQFRDAVMESLYQIGSILETLNDNS